METNLTKACLALANADAARSEDPPYTDLTEVQERSGASYLTSIVADAQLVLNAVGITQGEPPVYNDPKGIAGSKKVPLGLIPAIAMAHSAWVHKFGAERYGPYNWRITGVCASTYVNAILRHLNAWREGEDLDPESGITHLAHVACCCNILMDAAHCGTLQDDRNKVPQNRSC